MQTHRIQKVNISIDSPNQQEAEEVRSKYLGLFKKKVLPELSALFDTYSTNKEIIRIDKLKIDLGVLTDTPNSIDFNKRLVAKINQQLKELIAKKHTVTSPVQIISVQQSKLEQIIHFLKFGYFTNSSTDLTTKEDIHTLVITLKQDFFKAIEQAYRQSGSYVLQRFINHCEEATLLAFISTRLGNNVANKYWNYLEQLGDIKTIKRASLKQAATITLLKIVFSEEPQKAPINLDVFKQFLQKELKEKEQVGATAIEGKVDNKSNIDTAYYCQNVGVILLHPFLKTLFTKLDLLTAAQQFKSDWAKQKGVYVLDYIANGEQTSEEHQLVFQKIACAWPIHFPLRTDIHLTRAEKEEAELMMQAALNHWKGIGNTSPSGLREGFLQRAGKIQAHKKDWLVQIESKTIDLLLDKISWNIAMVKWPWLEEMIWVEWR